MEIQGYTLHARIHEGPTVEVYRGTRLSDNLSIALKVPRSDYPSAASLRKYRHEFELTGRIESGRVIRYLALEEVAGKLALVSEYRGEVSIEERIPTEGLSVDFFLPIAVEMVSALEDVHGRQIIHKDVKPANFLITASRTIQRESGTGSDSDTMGLRLIDFACATELTREHPSLLSPNMLEGSLPYISPEQTGRINRAIDYRTDYYSLGASFYQMLTGRPPFEYVDEMELVHSHIARLAVSPSKLKPGIPPQLSRIVLKLLGKTAEERYQSTSGIMADLVECLSQWKSNLVIEEFALGQRDRTDRFIIPQKLYGREREIEQLLQAFSRAARTPFESSGSGAKELLFVSGFSGIGKTSLIHELYKPVTQARGYFIAGKHDQYQRNVPYRALVQAFQDLVRQLLTEPESKLAEWKERLVGALGENAQVIVDVIPETELIIGKQPPAPELGGREARNRFNYVFRNFVKVFASPEHPLVLFLDDLQWADSASLQLIHLLLADSTVQNLLLIGAYRDNEVHAGHPLLMTIDGIIADRVIPSTVQLAPMADADVENLLRDAFQEDTVMSDVSGRASAIHGLVTLLLNKTGGNPFFLTQFLQELYNEGLLRHDRAEGRWTWELSEIEKHGMTENVVELMAEKIAKLPDATQIILQRAACIGNIFELGLLSVMSSRSESEAIAELWPAEKEGLILSASGHEDVLSSKRSWRFLHDRVQQAAYFAVPQSELAALHAQIGNLLIRASSPEERDERLFTIVNHLNLGRTLATTDESRDSLFALNMEAGIKARQGAAFDTSFNYLSLAREILFERYGLHVHSDEDVEKLWRIDYARALAAYSEEAEARFLMTDFDGMKACVDTVFRLAKTVLDKIRSHDMLLQVLISQSKTKEVVARASQLLKELRHPLPMNPSKLRILRSYARTRIALLGTSDKRLNNLPELKNPYEVAILRILNTAGASIYYEAPNFFPLMIFEAMNIILRHGVSPPAPSFVVAYGFLLCDPLNSIELGTKFGDLALGIMNRFQTGAFSARAENLYGSMIAPWTRPLWKSLDDPKMLATRALERGDLEFAATIGWGYAFFCLQMGAELEQTRKTVAEVVAFIAPLKQSKELIATHMIGATVGLLTGHTGPDDSKGVRGDPGRLNGSPGSILVSDFFDERAVLGEQAEQINHLQIVSLYLCKMQIATIFGDRPMALRLAEEGLPHLPAATGFIVIPLYTFYHALAILGMWGTPDDRSSGPDDSKGVRGSSAEERSRAHDWSARRKQLAAYTKRMKRWAKHNPFGILHKYELVQAEQARLRGRYAEAERLYALAATHARESKLLQEEAIVHEHAACYFEQRGDKQACQSHLREARFVYEKWGARAKVEQMDMLYPELREEGVQNDSTRADRHSTTHSASRELRGETLDLATIMKAAGALSENIELEAVLRSLIRIMIESAGAERAVLLLMDEGELWIEAEGYSQRSIVGDAESAARADILQHISIREGSGSDVKIPVSIVQYVARVREDVVLADARVEELFAADPYIVLAAPRSVLVTPLVNQGKLTGILYFENNLTADAFSRDRVELLRMLSSQAAISIENARLYTDLAETNRAYSRFVPREFLSFLHKGSIRKVQLGDQIERDMTILFADIRSFTTMSEKMTPAENFQFLNSVLGLIGPVIRKHKGFIDTYVGDAIMALFPDSPEDAVNAAIEVQERLREFSDVAVSMGRGSADDRSSAVAMGIGIHTGKLMLGIIGEYERMQGTVIADAVNLASRIENLTKQYGASILISSELRDALPSPEKFHLRKVDCVRVKGKSRGVVLLEVLDAQTPEVLERRVETLSGFEAGIERYFNRDFQGALPYFEAILERSGDDPLVRLYLDRVARYEREGVPSDWQDPPRPI